MKVARLKQSDLVNPSTILSRFDNNITQITCSNDTVLFLAFAIYIKDRSVYLTL